MTAVLATGANSYAELAIITIKNWKCPQKRLITCHTKQVLPSGEEWEAINITYITLQG